MQTSDRLLGLTTSAGCETSINNILWSEAVTIGTLGVYAVGQPICQVFPSIYPRKLESCHSAWLAGEMQCPEHRQASMQKDRVENTLLASSLTRVKLEPYMLCCSSTSTFSFKFRRKKAIFCVNCWVVSPDFKPDLRVYDCKDSYLPRNLSGYWLVVVLNGDEV